MVVWDVGVKMLECVWWEVFDVDCEELGFLVVVFRSLEGWMRKRREEMLWMIEGMVICVVVKEELRKRGV